MVVTTTNKSSQDGGGAPAPPDPRYDNLQAVWQSFERFQAVLSPEAVDLLSKAFNLDAVPT
jgi:hypothetical protein